MAERKRVFKKIDDETGRNDNEDNSAKKTIRTLERKATLDKWQAKWTTAKHGSWTRRLIPDISKWIAWGPMMVDYHFTQFVTGCGSFNSHLKKIGKLDTDECWLCGTAPDDAEHALFSYSRWITERDALQTGAGAIITPDNIIDLMQKEETRARIAEYVTRVMACKEETERRRQRQ